MTSTSRLEYWPPQVDIFSKLLELVKDFGFKTLENWANIFEKNQLRLRILRKTAIKCAVVSENNLMAILSHTDVEIFLYKF